MQCMEKFIFDLFQIILKKLTFDRDLRCYIFKRNYNLTSNDYKLTLNNMKNFKLCLIFCRAETFYNHTSHT